MGGRQDRVGSRYCRRGQPWDSQASRLPTQHIPVSTQGQALSGVRSAQLPTSMPSDGTQWF